MTTTSILDPVAERVELLLAKYEALVQTNRLLTEEIEAVRKERDSLQSRLKAARARVDDLIERLPANREASEPARHANPAPTLRALLPKMGEKHSC